ncbi:CaiB/BaiF CoA transferase family protein [Arthrobacter sp. EPSL27]|uniref:CaiB/BaiF CoA transferase family protein n=1 Tax=Arthrobacter sp. EPSL27 TaxID=1745378 RepID=UPI000745FB44|nr:CaiB/BaiF CoA-transferase family protein [Arthrobacter sp. EPSL27]KUM37407.1 carnitine dehydratase [Arthrobacter sp. EPSL27]
MPGRPLEGLIIVALEQAVAVPFATRQLADLGARVIKVERPGSGDFARGYDSKINGLSSAFAWLNRGKESVALDIKSEDGRAALEALIGRADVFLHNISPRAATKQGLDSETLARSHPRLIAGSVSGYGKSGPLCDSKAYDLLVQGETGLVSLTGSEDRMAKVGISIADIAAGMYVYSSVLAALMHRNLTGEALSVDVSLFDSLVEWLAYPLYYTQHGGTAPRRMGVSHATIAPYGAFSTREGHQVLLAVQNDSEWRRFCLRILGDALLAEDPRFNSHEQRIQNRTELDDIVTRRIAMINRDDLLAQLGAAEIAHSRLNTLDQLATHEQIVERNRWIPTESPQGNFQTLLPPWVPQGHDLDYGRIPAVGEDTEAICNWLGIDADALTLNVPNRKVRTA